MDNRIKELVTGKFRAWTGQEVGTGIRAAHIVVVDGSGNIIEPATSIKITEPVPLEGFDETDLTDGSYTVVTTDEVTGFGIHNNSTENSLTFTINSVAITVGAGSSFYFAFEEFSTVAVTGTSPSFNAFIAGYTS